MHDPRIGRFFAIDPLSPLYPHYTPYSFSGNKLIAFVELEGLEEQSANDPSKFTLSQPLIGRTSVETMRLNLAVVDPGFALAERQAAEVTSLYPELVLATTGIVAVGLVGGIAAVDAGAVATGVFLLNELKDEGLSQATDGWSDYFDLSKMVAKGFRNLASSPDDLTNLGLAKNPWDNWSVEKMLDNRTTRVNTIKEHEEKLAKFLKDPMGNTDPALMKQMKADNPTDEVLRKRVMGRVPALEKQIKWQKEELRKLDQEINKVQKK